jgi:hypothetical protein
MIYGNGGLKGKNVIAYSRCCGVRCGHRTFPSVTKPLQSGLCLIRSFQCYYIFAISKCYLLLKKNVYNTNLCQTLWWCRRTYRGYPSVFIIFLMRKDIVTRWTFNVAINSYDIGNSLNLFLPNLRNNFIPPCSYSSNTDQIKPDLVKCLLFGENVV